MTPEGEKQVRKEQPQHIHPDTHVHILLSLCIQTLLLSFHFVSLLFFFPPLQSLWDSFHCCVITLVFWGRQRRRTKQTFVYLHFVLMHMTLMMKVNKYHSLMSPLRTIKTRWAQPVIWTCWPCDSWHLTTFLLMTFMRETNASMTLLTSPHGLECRRQMTPLLSNESMCWKRDKNDWGLRRGKQMGGSFLFCRWSFPYVPVLIILGFWPYFRVEGFDEIFVLAGERD